MSTPAHIQWSARTDTGRFRKNNEDSFLALTIDRHGFQFLGKYGRAPLDNNDYVFAVSDGMGGARAGEFASRITVQKIADLLPANFKMGAMGFRSNHEDILSEVVNRIEKEMESMAFHYEECRGMGATLSLAWITPGWLHFAHVGDSRIYYLPVDGSIKQLTTAHTRVAELLRQGMINKHDARTHPERNVLTNVLGGKVDSVEPQLGAVGFNPGDQFLLCSDGITEGIRDHRIETLLRSPPERFQNMDPCERLITDANEESGQDNATALIIEIAQE